MAPPSPPRSLARVALLLTLGIFVVLTAINGRFYFATPFFEQGDIAAYGLQIYRAKHGTEILGNYSRFHFNHPGPAFWYVYVAGERVLRDWLGVASSPHNAHSLAGLFLQSFFFATALALFYDALRTPLFLPLALLLGAAHFGRAGQAFTSVWPPHVLLMPFLCFFAACASVASGRGGRLPLVVLAGGFLVHGHVAQPLFVIVLSGIAYALLWRETRRSAPGLTPWRAEPRAHLLAGAVCAVFLLPLVVDWLRWPNDNLALIIQHLEDHANEHKSLRASLLYFLSFFSYLDNQDQLFPDGGRLSTRFLAHHAAWYAAWIAVGGLIAWRWRQMATAKGQADDIAVAPAQSGAGGSRDCNMIDLTPYAGRFLRAVALLWLVAALLCLAWGVIQDGPMYQFNGYFYFALLFVPLLLAAGALADWLGPRRRPAVAAVLCAAAAALAVRGIAFPAISEQASGLPLLAATRAVLGTDPHPAAPKILVFSHDDWPAVITAALVLTRARIPFQVDPSWGFMFGASRNLPSQLPAPTIDGASVWRFLRHAPSGEGAPFPGNLRVAFAPGRLDPAHGVITFSKNGNWEQFQLSGFTTPDRDTSYTNQPEAVLEIAGAPAARDVAIDIRAPPYLVSRRIPAQPMELWVNGVFAGRAVLDRLGVRDSDFQVPAAAWNRRSPAMLVMRFPAARSPAQLHINGDPRILGWELRTIKFGN